MMTYIIIIGIVIAIIIIACLISPTVKKYVKWIGGGLVVIGGGIAVIATLGRKKSDQKADAKIAEVQGKIDATQHNIDQDLTNISHTDVNIKEQEHGIQTSADKAKAAEKAQEAKPAPTGSDQGKAGDDLLGALK